VKSEANLGELIVAQMAEAVIYCDRRGVIERWNAAATAVFGFTAEEALGHGLDLIIPEHLRAAHWRGFDAAVARGSTRLQGRASITRGLHKSGRKCYVEMSFALLHDASGTVLGSIAVARDVSERIEREKQAAAAAAAPKTS